MFDLGWQELFIIAALVIIVIGPKDIPRTMRAVSGWIRKGRELAREFQGGVNDMVRQADLDDIKLKIDTERLTREIKNGIDPDGTISREVRDIETGAIEAGLDTDQVKAAVSDEVSILAPQPGGEPSPAEADAKGERALPRNEGVVSPGKRPPAQRRRGRRRRPRQGPRGAGTPRGAQRPRGAVRRPTNGKVP